MYCIWEKSRLMHISKCNIEWIERCHWCSIFWSFGHPILSSPSLLVALHAYWGHGWRHWVSLLVLVSSGYTRKLTLPPTSSPVSLYLGPVARLVCGGPGAEDTHGDLDVREGLETLVTISVGMKSLIGVADRYWLKYIQERPSTSKTLG